MILMNVHPVHFQLLSSDGVLLRKAKCPLLHLYG